MISFNTEFVQKELIRDLLKECIRMYEFDHPNVLKLLGVCMDPSPYIIMLFMANGSRNVYLKKERENVFPDPESAKPDDTVSEYYSEMNLVWVYCSKHSSL